MIVWVAERTTLTRGKKVYKVGDTIPDGVLTPTRLDQFVNLGFVQITDLDEKPAKIEKQAKPKTEKAVKPVEVETEKTDFFDGNED